MIYSFSHRTDGPAYYWAWFLSRLEEGFAQVRNPYYPDNVSTYDLVDDTCEGFVFTSKNYFPVIDGRARLYGLDDLVEKYATEWRFTITPYRSDIERCSPSNVDAVNTAKVLSRIVGRKRLTWLYSPIAMYDGVYDWSYHIAAFEWLAQHLSESVSRVSLDVLRVYEKVARNAAQLREPHFWEMEIMMPRFVEIANTYGIEVHACPANADWSRWGIDMSPCMSLKRFGELNGLELRNIKVAKGSGLFATCPEGCASVRDLAAYGTCPCGCVYCYANPVPGQIVGQYSVASPMLMDVPRMYDRVSSAKQKRYFK